MPTNLRCFQSKNSGIGSIFEGIYLIEGSRTPFGSFLGSLSNISPTDLGIISSRAVLNAAKLPGSEIDQTIVANVGHASCDSFFLPRHIGLYSGAREQAPALLLQRICGSGIEILGYRVNYIHNNNINKTWTDPLVSLCNLRDGWVVFLKCLSSAKFLLMQLK